MIKVGEARKRKRTKPGRKFLTYMVEYAVYAIYASLALEGWTNLNPCIDT